MTHIYDIVTRFGRHNWLVQKTKENFWALRPQGTYNYKVFLLTYNPFTKKFQIVKPPNPDPHYDEAVKILEGCDRPLKEKSDRVALNCVSIIKVPSMFPVKIGNYWINLAQIRTLAVAVDSPNENQFTVTICWENGEMHDFKGRAARELFDEWEKACDLVMRRYSEPA